jgi:hypothetical protein
VVSDEAESDPSSEDRRSRILSADFDKTLLYICDVTVATTDATATPITEPATPICEANSIDVTAAKAPARICATETSSNMLSFFEVFAEPCSTRISVPASPDALCFSLRAYARPPCKTIGFAKSSKQRHRPFA